jgi:polar amino acid transport system substrate-binding protein
MIPNYWNPGERLARPDISNLPRLRFLTTTDFPPFNFIDRRKRLAGFHVDLARAVCVELGIAARCEIQALPWDEIGPAIEKGDGEAIIAGLEITGASREKYVFSRPYLHIPARFAARNGTFATPEQAMRSAKPVAVVAGSVHAKWFAITYPNAKTKDFPHHEAAFAAMKNSQVEAVFTDAVSLSFWLASPDAADCCSFLGGPYLAPEFFGEGMAIAFPKEQAELAAAADYALREINDKGGFAELYLRYFPLGLY